MMARFLLLFPLLILSCESRAELDISGKLKTTLKACFTGFHSQLPVKEQVKNNLCLTLCSVGSRERHEKKSVGMYKTKEEVERPPVWDHPCNLTRTAVKISFPAMKEEVFVNFLGYREPNLQYVMRCKGVCGEKEQSQPSCVPTKVRQRLQVDYIQLNK